MSKIKKKLILLDSNALIHRAYHALPPLSNKEGQLTNAVYGYALTLFSVLDKFKPEYIAATFDLEGPTFRHEQYDQYKATREKAPDDLYEQIPMVKEMLQAFNIPIYEKKGFEADDIIGTITNDPNINGEIEKIIVTGDLDALQLVDENTKVFTLRKGITDTVVYDIERVKDRYTLTPDQIIDYKALKGDPSDNIPGVKGVGDKTATELLIKYKNLDGIYHNIDKISGSTHKKLLNDEENAYLSYDLAKIDRNVPIEFSLDESEAKNFEEKKLVDFLSRMGFHTLISRHFPEYQKKEKKSEEGLKMEEPKILKTGEELEELKIDFDSKSKTGIHFLGSDENCYLAEARGAGIAIAAKKSINTYFLEEKALEKFLQKLKKGIFELAGFNIKKDIQLASKALKNIDFKVLRKVFAKTFDTQIGAYLLQSGTDTSVEKLIMEEFGEKLKYKTTKSGQSSLLADNSENEKLEAAEVAGWSLRLAGVYEKRLGEISENQKKYSKNNIVGVYDNLEKPLISILAEMEMFGIEVSKESLKKVSEVADGKIKDYEKSIYQKAGEEFNINSPIQLAEILYKKLQIPTAGIKRGKTGYSTDADQLRKIRHLHPIVAEVEDYRELFKLKTTYADALPKLVTGDGRIHAKFNQAVTATGRLSSSDPNLQNIPKRGELAGEIRKSFVAGEGKKFLALDYSQIDLRAAAHLSGDEKMIQIFKDKKDFHSATAAWVNEIDEAEVTSKMRSEAKSLNFGILYGMGVYGFMRDSGVDRERAEFFIDQYMKSFSGLKKYLDETKEFTRKHGYIETELGRRRYIPNINASNQQLRAAAERMAINLPIQGLSADIMKLAMVKVQEEILEKADSSEIALVLQVHDELIFEVDEKKVEKYAEEIKKVMENVYQLKVPMVVESSTGENWGEL